MHHLSLVIIFCIKETSCISLCCNYHKMQQCTIFCNKDTHDIFLSQYPFHTKIHIKNKSFIIATFSVLNTQIIYLYVTIIYIYILIYFLSIYQSFYLSIHLFFIYLYSVYQVVCDLVGCIRLENMLGGGDLVRQAAERGLLSRPWQAGH